MRHEETINLSFNDACAWQDFLNGKGDGTLSTRKTFTANFGDKGEGEISIDIKVCDGGDSTPFIDAVMFQDGDEVACLDVTDTLAGEYVFDGFLKDTYVVIVPDAITSAEAGQKQYRAVERWLGTLTTDKVVKIYNNMTDTDIVDKYVLIESILDRTSDGDILEELYKQSLGTVHFNADNNSPQCFTDKFLAVEIIICRFNNTWDTDYVYLPYPEAGEMLQETKDKATTQWQKEYDERDISLGTVTFVGVYNINWDELVDKDGNPLDE